MRDEVHDHPGPPTGGPGWFRGLSGLPAQGRPPGSRSPALAERPTALTAESRRACPRCGTPQATLPVEIPPQLRAVAGADRRWFWADCRCETERQQRYIHRQAELDAALHAREARAALAESGLEPLDEMTLATFDPRRLRSTDGAHPYQVATRWLADIADLPRARYADPGGPPAALYFYCPGKGRGKTHLAAALAWELCRSERVAFLHEEAYCSRLWSVPF